ncbi:hypothetical protein BKK42_04335 [Bacillus cereus]|nr:hypothetical protein BKK43_10080 [Bacillus cereus]ONG86958.1 hypothetical protein BKK42_04335 [Bacillus cereus]
MLEKNLLFKKLLYSQITAAVGETFLTIALATLAVQITGSGIAAAWLISINAVATFTIGFAAGWLIDRKSRKKMMLISDIARAILLIPFFFLTSDTFWIAYILTFFIACFSSLFHPARESYIQSIFTSEERLNIVATVQSNLSMITLIGPSIAGFLVAIINIKLAFIINMLCFIISAFYIYQIKDEPLLNTKEKGGFWPEVFSGWIYIFKNRPLLNLNITRILLTMGLAIYAIVSYQILVEVSNNLNHVISYVSFSLLLGIATSLQGLGSFCAGLIIKKKKQSFIGKYDKLLVTSGLLLSVGYIAWGIGSVYIIFIGSFIIGLGLVIGRIGIISIGQEIVDPEYMGRSITAGDAIARLSHIVTMGLSSTLILILNTNILMSVAFVLALVILLLNIKTKGGEQFGKHKKTS